MTEDRSSCANCEQPLTGRYCSECGQENRNLARIPLRELLGDWLGDAFTFDSRVARTLLPLVGKPGFLTLEYLAGRRVRYVPPFRLFVFLSLVMFLLLAALGGAVFAWKITGEGGKELVTSESPSLGEVDGESVSNRDDLPDLPTVLDDPDEISRRILDRAPQATLALVPVFAFFVWVLHRRREPLYAPHLIFSLHLHCFVFVVVLASSLVNLPFQPDHQPAKLLGIVGVPLYLHLAQKRVYGGGWLINLLFTSALLVAHFFAWLALMLGVLWLVVWMA